jgi:hypothetical protein
VPPHTIFIFALALAACAAPVAAPATVEVLVPPAPEPALPDAPAPCALDGAGVFYVAGENPTRPLVRYADGQLGPSDHCAIRTANKLSRLIPPVYVNGRPIGFC